MDTKYIAYVGSYTFHGSSEGISVLDVDVEKGRFYKRKEVAVNNASYLCTSTDNQYLYAVVDEGIAAYQILPDGDLAYIRTSSIKGMRGCFLTTDKANRYLVTAGFHDGKMTILRINEDGSVGEITAEIYDSGIGSVAERNFRPHITCVCFTPDEQYLCMADSGIDSVKIYRFNHEDGTIRLVDIIHCEVNSAPRQIRFSPCGRQAYIISELKNYISVYNYHHDDTLPEFEFKQLVSTVPKKSDEYAAACSFKISTDGQYLFCSNAGENTVGFFKRDVNSGLLYLQSILPISGEYPKDVTLFPDNRHLVCMNQDSNTLTFFTIDYEKGVLVMNGLPLKLDNPNCGIIVPLSC